MLQPSIAASESEAGMGNGDRIWEVASDKQKIHAKRDYADTTMSAASKLLTFARLNSVSFSRANR